MASKASSFFSGLATVIIITALAKFAWDGAQKFILPLFHKTGDAVRKTVAPETHAAIEQARENAANPPPIARPLSPADRALIQKLRETESTVPSAGGHQPARR